MADWFDPLVKPAVAVALLSVAVQGVKAAVDLVSQVRARRISSRQAAIAYVTALFTLVDGVPLDDAERAVLKSRLARDLLPGVLPEAIRKAMGD
jgi:hypothetical protein